MKAYFELTPAERAGWKRHFSEFPPGDFLAQRLLATLCSMVASLGGGKAVSPKQFAPWLTWHEDGKDEDVPFEQTLEAMAMAEIMNERNPK